MNDYAPLYSRKERARIALLLALVIVPLALLSHFWLIPKVSVYVEFANCYSYGAISGVELLLYVAFVGMPFSFAMIILLLLGKRCIRVIRSGQDPLPGEKVLRRTQYRYGKAAMILPALVLLVVLVMVGFAIWGGFQVEKFNRIVTPCSSEQLQQMNP